jgi:hypothetical protein
VDLRVQSRGRLAQHVRAFEMAERRLCIAERFCATTGFELGFDSWADAVMKAGHEFLLREFALAEILLSSGTACLNEAAEIGAQRAHVACMATAVAGAMESTTVDGRAVGGCHATIVAAASSANVATRTTLRIGVAAGRGDELEAFMAVSSMKVMESSTLTSGEGQAM